MRSGSSVDLCYAGKKSGRIEPYPGDHTVNRWLRRNLPWSHLIQVLLYPAPVSEWILGLQLLTLKNLINNHFRQSWPFQSVKLGFSQIIPNSIMSFSPKVISAAWTTCRCIVVEQNILNSPHLKINGPRRVGGNSETSMILDLGHLKLPLRDFTCSYFMTVTK